LFEVLFFADGFENVAFHLVRRDRDWSRRRELELVVDERVDVLVRSLTDS